MQINNVLRQYVSNQVLR